MVPFEEYALVRVTKLLMPDRWYTGGEGKMRPPLVGDVGTILDIYPGSAAYIVECVDRQDGVAIWVADFLEDELELAEAE